MNFLANVRAHVKWLTENSRLFFAAIVPFGWRFPTVCHNYMPTTQFFLLYKRLK